MLKKIFSIEKTEKHKMVTILGIKFKIKRKDYELECRIKNLEEGLKDANKKIYKSTPRIDLPAVETHIVEHCNLRCYSCSHFANIAEEEFLSLEEFEKDYTRLYELTNGNIKRINLLGGEPLLHPQCTEFCAIARRLFKDAQICLVTNGILLPSMEDEFFKKIAEYKINLRATQYPVEIDWKIVEEKFKKFNVEFEFYDMLPDGFIDNKLCWHREALNLTGHRDSMGNFLACPNKNQLVYFEHGYISPCSVVPYIKHFNKFFNQNISVTNNDRISVYEVQNLNEICEFLAKPCDMCKYCELAERKKKTTWRRTNQEISEWVNQ